MLELRIAIRVGAAFLRLAVRLQAIPKGMQQLAYQLMRHLVAHALQFFGQLAHAFARPAQWRFRVSPRHRLYQALQVFAELGIFAHVALASASDSSDSSLLRSFSPLQFLDPSTDHLSRQPGRSGNGRDPSPAERERFVGGVETSRPLREFSGYPLVALLDFFFI